MKRTLRTIRLKREKVDMVVHQRLLAFSIASMTSRKLGLSRRRQFGKRC